MSALTEAHAGPSPVARVGLPHAPLPSWLLLCVLLLVVMPFVQVATLGNYFFGRLLVELELPHLERQLGFTLGKVLTTGPYGPTNRDAVIAVEPGGVFDRAGVRPGDLLQGYLYGSRYGLAQGLHSHRGQDFEFRVLRTRHGKGGEATQVRVKVPGE